MKLIQRKPHLGWLIHFLAILLACFLIMNSLFGSIYVNQLKMKILGLTDNYFLAQKELFETREALSRNRSNIYRYILLNNSYLSKKERNDLKLNFLKETNKDFISIIAHTKRISRFNIDPYMTKSVKILTPKITQYTVTLKKSIDLNLNQTPENENKVLETLKSQEDKYDKMMFNLEILSGLIQEKAISIRISDDLLLKYLPSVFILSFIVTAIIGGCFIYVSRREVKKSILENTLQVLNEAREYQMDCIHTLEICKEISKKGTQKISEIYSSFDNLEHHNDFNSIVEKFKYHATKIELAFETRSHLHEREKAKLEKEIEEHRLAAKSLY